MSRILITGCSKGLGRATALELTRRGHEVVATARKVETLAELPVARRLALDVTDDASVKRALEEAGAIDVLVNNAAEIMDKVQPRTEVVGIDEAQFLGEELVDVCTKLANLGKRVIVAGLDTDYLGRPFEPMPRLLAIAEEIVKLLAICVRCGNPAVHTQRLVESEELVVVGATGIYEARCRRCFESNLALAQEKKDSGPQLMIRSRTISSGK